MLSCFLNTLNSLMSAMTWALILIESGGFGSSSGSSGGSLLGSSTCYNTTPFDVVVCLLSTVSNVLFVHIVETSGKEWGEGKWGGGGGGRKS